MLRIGRAKWTRWASLATVLCLIAVPLAGCGEGGGTPATVQPPQWPEPAKGSTEGEVNRAEVGGEGLKVLAATASAQEGTPNQEGRFTVSMSSEGAQLLAVEDSSRKIRALAVNIPDQALSVDAASTASCLVLMTPGILSVGVDEAKKRIDQVGALDAFDDLVDKVRNHLEKKSVSEVVAQSEVGAALAACVREWYDKHAPRASRARSIGNSLLFSVTSKEGPNPPSLAKTEMELRNRAWRYVGVQRRDLRGAAEPRVVDVVGSLAGAIPASWGSLAASSLGEPSARLGKPGPPILDVADFSSASGANTSEYWVAGPGYATVPDMPPTGVRAFDAGVWGQSLVQYALFPLLSLASGSTKLFLDSTDKILDSTDKMVKAADAVWKAANADAKVQRLLESLSSKASDEGTVTANAIDAVAAILGLAIAGDVFAGMGAAVSNAATVLGIILAAGAVAMGAANLILLYVNWKLVPPVLKIAVSFNRPPQITALVAEPGDVLPGKTAAVKSTSVDPDGDTLSYAWQASGGTIRGTDAQVTWTAPATAGQYTITCTVSDTEQAQASKEVIITVSAAGTGAPTISSLSADKNDVAPGGTATLTCTAQDPDGDPLSYSWQASGGTITGPGSQVAWTAAAQTGRYTVTCTVSDGKGGQAVKTVAVTVTTTTVEVQ